MLFLWATPRSISTAFEWMMRQRGDVACFHEPFNEAYYYGSDRRSSRDAGVADTDGLSFAAVWDSLAAAEAAGPVFVKDFAYSVEHDLTDTRLARITSTFLIRDPRRVIQGLANHWPDCTSDEVGFTALHRLFHRVADRLGAPPPVLSSADLLDHPEAATEAYCRAVGIAFDPAALAWDAGERREVSWYGDGSGPWHDTLRESTGIQKPTTVYPPLEDDPRLVELHDEARPLYEEMLSYALPVTAPA
ncbi:MAG: sulfotransferase family protein [Actinomycetota bacterium]